MDFERVLSVGVGREVDIPSLKVLKGGGGGRFFYFKYNFCS